MADSAPKIPGHKHAEVVATTSSQETHSPTEIVAAAPTSQNEAIGATEVGAASIAASSVGSWALEVDSAVSYRTIGLL